jgi:adenylate cyclase
VQAAVLQSFKSWQYQLAGFVLCLTFATFVNFFKLGETLDHIVLSRQFKLLREYHPQAVPNDVVVVGIDEATYAAFKEPFALWHAHLGELFQALALAKPALVGLDVVLPERSYYFINPEYDKSLLEGMVTLRAQSPVLLGHSVDGNGKFRHIFSPFLSVAGVDSQASVMVCLDDDGVARHFAESLCAANTPVNTMAGLMAALQQIKKEKWSGLIDYSVGRDFAYIPFLEVLSWYEKGKVSRLQQAFAGKPVLIGVIMPYTDRIIYPVPIASWEPGQTKLPGVLLHAQAYRSMRMHGLIQDRPGMLIFSLTLIAAMIFWLGKTSWIKIALLVIFMASMMSLSLLQLRQGYYLPVTGILMSGLFAVIARAIYEAFVQIREKRMLKRAFGSYVSPQILQEIIAGHIKPGLGGERKRLCVLFADIRDFTTRSEQLSPEEVVTLLNGYFTEMTAAIHTHDGTVDKFIGDGLMAFFGAPKMLECAERNALSCAREMLFRLQAYNLKLQSQNQQPIRIGIGLHVGEVIVGHVGSELRNEYTAIGDVVNTASRLEGITKILGYPVICSRDVAQTVGFFNEMVDLGRQPIKGHTDIAVYGWNPLG